MDFSLDDIKEAYLAGCIDTDRNFKATIKDWKRASEAYCQYLLSEKDPQLYDSINGGTPKGDSYFGEIGIGEKFLFLKQEYIKLNSVRGQRIGDGETWLFGSDDVVNSLTL